MAETKEHHEEGSNSNASPRLMNSDDEYGIPRVESVSRLTTIDSADQQDAKTGQKSLVPDAAAIAELKKLSSHKLSDVFGEIKEDNETAGTADNHSQAKPNSSALDETTTTSTPMKKGKGQIINKQQPASSTSSATSSAKKGSKIPASSSSSVVTSSSSSAKKALAKSTKGPSSPIRAVSSLDTHDSLIGGEIRRPPPPSSDPKPPVIGMSKFMQFPRKGSNLYEDSVLELQNRNLTFFRFSEFLTSSHRYRMLKVLVLRNNKISHITALSLFSFLPNCTDCDLSYNELAGRITDIDLPRRITRLDLSYNYLVDITGIMSCIELKELNLSFNNIKSLYGLPIKLNRLGKKEKSERAVICEILLFLKTNTFNIR
jgi:hypothetical protein